MKLRRLREKLRKLKADYNYNDDEEETEKSEMETLKDLKQATEQAIRELQEEAVRANKRKGWNTSSIIKKFYATPLTRIYLISSRAMASLLSLNSWCAGFVYQKMLHLVPNVTTLANIPLVGSSPLGDSEALMSK